MNKRIVAIIFTILMLFSVCNVYATDVVVEKKNNYVIDDFISQELIESDRYFTDTSAIDFLNDLFKHYLFDIQFESVEEFKAYITESEDWSIEPSVTYDYEATKAIIRHYKTHTLEELDNYIIKKYISTQTIQELANENKLVILLADEDFYIVHPHDENDLDNILYTSTIGNQNWYKLKTKIDNLYDSYKNINLLYAEFPEAYWIQKDLESFTELDGVGYVDNHRMNFRTRPNLESTIIQKIYKDEEVNIISENEKWYYVEYNGLFGFVSKKYIAIKTAIISADGIERVYPLSDWANRRIGSRFGMRYHPIDHVWKMHNGMDISAAMGTPVFATEAGVVTQARWSDTGGWFVDVRHDSGYTTRYCHSSQLLVTAGQVVKAGDIIMLVGSTGKSTGPHLHFACLKNGEFINPEEYLALIGGN